jgi:hypothetical protein
MLSVRSFESVFGVAGADRIELSQAVLETASLPLTYAPKPVCAARPVKALPRNSSLLDFPMRAVLPAERAKLLEFQTLRRGLLVLRVRIISILTLGALKRNNFASHSPYL